MYTFIKRPLLLFYPKYLCRYLHRQTSIIYPSLFWHFNWTFWYLRNKKKLLQWWYFWIILDILKTNMNKWKKVNVQDATENLVPRVVLKDMKGNKNVQRRPKYMFCYESILLPKICIKYEKHWSPSFSHTFNCVWQWYRGPIFRMFQVL